MVSTSDHSTEPGNVDGKTDDEGFQESGEVIVKPAMSNSDFQDMFLLKK